MKNLRKRIIICSSIIIISLLLFNGNNDMMAQGISFEKGDWASVLKKAKKSNKLIFVDIYTTWCGPCKHLDKHTFSNKEVGDYFNSNFICYKLDAEKGEGVNLSKKFKVTSYPNLLFVNRKGEIVIRKKGFINAEQMLELGSKALNAEDKTKRMTAEYKKGNRSQEFILKYLELRNDRELPTENIFIDYIKTLDKKLWLTKENLSLIKSHINSPDNEVVEYIVNNRAAHAKTEIGIWHIPITLDQICKKYIRQSVSEGMDSDDIEKGFFNIRKSLNKKEIDYYEFFTNRLVSSRDQDWDSYIKHTIDYVNTYASDQPVSLNNYAWGFYANKAITDPKALNTAIGWVNKALKKHTDYNFLDTKAALLFKLGNKKEALKTANEAVKLANETGGDSSGTLKLIKKIKAK